MSSADGESQVRKIVSDIGKVGGDFPIQSDFYTDLGLDSFRMVEIFLEIEKKFAISISEDEYLTLRSLPQFLELLQRTR